jgi:uncharacterized protein with PIN domain
MAMPTSFERLWPTLSCSFLGRRWPAAFACFDLAYYGQSRIVKSAAQMLLHTFCSSSAMLRLMGADVIAGCEPQRPALPKRAQCERRIVLARAKRLRSAHKVLFLKGDLFREPLREVPGRFSFGPRVRAFTRCECNEPPRIVTRECGRCGCIYWQGSGSQRALRQHDALGL